MRFDLVWLTFKIKSEPNQTNVVWLESVDAVFQTIFFSFLSNIKIKLKSYNTNYFQQCFKFHPTLQFYFHPTMFPTM